MSQEPYSQNLQVIAGNTFTLDFELTEEDANGNEVTATDLVGATGIFQVRDSVKSAELIASAVPLITPALGLVQVTLPAATTMGMLEDKRSSSKYVYALQLTYSDGTVNTIIAGKLEITRGVIVPVI